VRALQILVLGAQLLHQRLDAGLGLARAEPGVARGTRGGGGIRIRCGRFLQHHQVQVCCGGIRRLHRMGRRRADRMDGEVDARIRAVGLDLQPRHPHRLARGCRLVQGRGQAGTQALARHLHDVVDAGLAGRRLQEQTGAPVQVEDVAAGVDQRAGRGDLFAATPARSARAAAASRPGNARRVLAGSAAPAGVGAATAGDKLRAPVSCALRSRAGLRLAKVQFWPCGPARQTGSPNSPMPSEVPREQPMPPGLSAYSGTAGSAASAGSTSR
jgi:hypothetical protein